MFDNLKPVTLTVRAADEVRKIMRTKNIPAEYGLRLGVRGGGGCGGATLIIGFDKQKGTDLFYTAEGIPVYIEKKHTLFLIGKKVDFYDEEDMRGFMFVEQ